MDISQYCVQNDDTLYYNISRRAYPTKPSIIIIIDWFELMRRGGELWLRRLTWSAEYQACTTLLKPHLNDFRYNQQGDV
jgi:hypothetical protein